MTLPIIPYPKYKNGPEQGLPSLPGHWDVRRAKFFYRESDQRSVSGTEELMSVSHITGVTPRKKSVTMFLAESTEGYKLCQPGDIVINTMWAYMAALGVARQTGIVSPSYGVYRPRATDQMNPKYIDLLLRTELYRTQYNHRSTGITASRLRLYADDFLSIPLICPPLSEQTTIVRYLDHADDLINRYINAKERLIALLREQRQAVIHQAVTRGLDPKVVLKHSNVPQLGHVPNHWQVTQLGRIGVFSKGSGGTKDDEVAEGLPCVRYADIYTSHKYFVRQTRSFVAPHRAPDYAPTQYGDVLFTGSGETVEDIGKSVVNLINGEAYCGGDVILFRPRAATQSEFLGYLLDSPMVAHQKSCMGRGITIMHIYSSQLKYLWLAIPPFEEQTNIAKHLEKTTKRFDDTIQRTRVQIDLMNEYHTRLISDVVTGQLDVRTITVELPAEAR